MFHDGHKAMILNVREKNLRPVWVAIMETDEQPPALERMLEVRKWLTERGIPNIVTMIPPIASVNYGRDVGYEINHVELPDELEAISSTAILGGA